VYTNRAGNSDPIRTPREEQEKTMLQTDPNPIYTMLVREFGVDLDKESTPEPEAAQEPQPAPR
jgi:hypothetical protein